jgi:hypothetical protein
MTAEKYNRLYQRAKTLRDNWVPLFEECYEYSLPSRASFYSETAGQRRDEKIYDQTAVVGVQEFASRLQAGIVPNYARWADLIAGSEVPKEDRAEVNAALDEVTDYVFEILQNSNFSQEIHEAFQDLAVGTGVLDVSEGDAVNPVIFTSLPLTQVVLDKGPNSKIDKIFRERKGVRFSDLQVMYPKGKFDPKVLQKMKGEEETTVLEAVCRSYDRPMEEVNTYIAICQTTKTILYEEEMVGLGSNPLIAFRWGKASDEVYGRGPLMFALSSIKTANHVVRLILENAQMAIAGIYQMEDDGVINPDTINLVPGTIIPKAMGSRGLEAIQSAGRFDVSQLILSDERHNIKTALYNDMLGNPDRTPASATEIAERQADLSRRVGAAFGRLQAELVQPVLQRVVYILKKQGRINLPIVNGREVKIRSTSPLAQAQSNQDISSVARFLEMVNQSFGPESTAMTIDPEKVVEYLAKKFGVPESLIRTPEQRKQIAAAAQQMAQQQQQMMQQQQENPIG